MTGINQETPTMANEAVERAFPLNIADLIERMDGVIEKWDEEEPRELWWSEQRTFLEARDVLAAVNEGPPVMAVASSAAIAALQMGAWLRHRAFVLRIRNLPMKDVEKIEDDFWHEERTVADLDTSRHAVRRAIEFTLEASGIEQLQRALERIAQPVFVAEPAGTPDSAWRVALNERIEIANEALREQGEG